MIKEPIDYKDLLVRYMAHVICCEGVCFAPDPEYSRIPFTEEEAEELLNINNEAALLVK